MLTIIVRGVCVESQLRQIRSTSHLQLVAGLLEFHPAYLHLGQRVDGNLIIIVFRLKVGQRLDGVAHTVGKTYKVAEPLKTVLDGEGGVVHIGFGTLPVGFEEEPVALQNTPCVVTSLGFFGLSRLARISR